MIWLMILIAAYADDIRPNPPLASFRCKKPNNPNTLGSCIYDAIIIYDEKGKEHTFTFEKVRKKAIEELEK